VSIAAIEPPGEATRARGRAATVPADSSLARTPEIVLLRVDVRYGNPIGYPRRFRYPMPTRKFAKIAKRRSGGRAIRACVPFVCCEGAGHPER